MELKLVPVDGKTEVRYQRPQHHARLLAQRRGHGASASTRKASSAPATPCCGSTTNDIHQGLQVRRPHRRGLQARHRHLRQRRAAAREDHRRRRALRAGRGDHRPQPARKSARCSSRRRPCASWPACRPTRRCKQVLESAAGAGALPAGASTSWRPGHRQRQPRRARCT